MMRDEADLPEELRAQGLDVDDLDGHTIEQLAEYLDAGRIPPDPSIDESASCQLALRAMERLRGAAGELFMAETAAEPEPDERWIQRVLSGIALDARAGRRIPIGHASPDADLGVTEGAVRSLIRDAETEVSGVLIDRTALLGDVTVPGEPVRIEVRFSVAFGQPLPQTAERLRAAIAGRLSAHTELKVTAIDLVIHDLRMPSAPRRRSHDD